LIVVELRQPQIDFQVLTIVNLIFFSNNFFPFFRVAAAASRPSFSISSLFPRVAAAASRGKHPLAAEQFRCKWVFYMTGGCRNSEKKMAKVWGEFGPDLVAHGGSGLKPLRRRAPEQALKRSELCRLRVCSLRVKEMLPSTY